MKVTVSVQKVLERINSWNLFIVFYLILNAELKNANGGMLPISNPITTITTATTTITVATLLKGSGRAIWPNPHQITKNIKPQITKLKRIAINIILFFWY